MSSYAHASMVMDLSPWNGHAGFQGTQAWWSYVMDMSEDKRLDHLLGAALLNNEICQRLVQDRDENLLESFGISERTKQWLLTIEADSLTDLAQAIAVNYRKIA